MKEPLPKLERFFHLICIKCGVLLLWQRCECAFPYLLLREGWVFLVSQRSASYVLVVVAVVPFCL